MIGEPYELPVIRSDDYDAFRAIPTLDLPDTYDEWLKLFAERKSEHAQRAFRIIEIKVNSHEFARYLAAKRTPGNLKTLSDFTIEKSLGHHY